jgi:hypothetical protein
MQRVPVIVSDPVILAAEMDPTTLKIHVGPAQLPQ